ncbi:unnamed protein product, partial [Musa acuminata subsp. burmannicoides]
LRFIFCQSQEQTIGLPSSCPNPILRDRHGCSGCHEGHPNCLAIILLRLKN